MAQNLANNFYRGLTVSNFDKTQGSNDSRSVKIVYTELIIVKKCQKKYLESVLSFEY